MAVENLPPPTMCLLTLNKLCDLLVIIYLYLLTHCICAISMAPCSCYVVYMWKGSVHNGRGKCNPPPSMCLLP